MQASYQQNRKLHLSVKRRKNQTRKEFANTNTKESDQLKPHKKAGRIGFLRESRAERQKIALFMFILMMITTAILISLILFPESSI